MLTSSTSMDTCALSAGKRYYLDSICAVPATSCNLLSRFQGHSDIISGIGYVHAFDCYITSSWDGALRLWKRPQPAAAAAAVTSTSTGKPSTAAASGDAAYLLPEDSADAANYVSEYEKARPLVMPKALSQVRSTTTCCTTTALQTSCNGSAHTRCYARGSLSHM
jgi:WD40 repeat protein